MYIRHSYESEFEHLYLDLKDKYPKQIFQLEGIDESQLDVTQFSKNYFLKKNVADASIDQNANVQIKTVATYKSEVHKGEDKLNSLYLIWKTAKKLYGTRIANRLIEEEVCKDLNIQDSSNSFLPYCFAFDTIDVVTNGLPFITNMPSGPAKHADTFLRHCEQLIMFASHQLMGATAIPNALVIYSALLKIDSLDDTYPVYNYKTQPEMFDKYIRQEFQKFIYTLNQPIRQIQSAFTNITIFDSIFLKELCKMYVIGGDPIDPEFAMFVQKKFLQFFNEFNRERIFTFPVLTVQFKKDFNNELEDKEFFEYICDVNTEFANLNIFSASNLTALSSCCRLINNIEDLIQATKEENMNLIGGSSIKVGSFGVTTLNLPRIAIKSKKDTELFFDELRRLCEDAFMINNCRRELIIKMIEQDQLPLYSSGFMNLDNQYSTLGILGIFETVEIMGFDNISCDGKNFAISILKFIDEIVKNKIKKYGYRCNVEQIPAEATSPKLAKVDKILYKQDKYKLYSNQFLPLTTETDILNRIELQELYERYFSGGTILHVNVANKIKSKRVMKKLMEYVIKSGVQYFAVNYFFQKCKNGHLTIDSSIMCNICGGEVIERYTRIVGFLTPVSSWQEERREEFYDRKRYSEDVLPQIQSEERIKNVS